MKLKAHHHLAIVVLVVLGVTVVWLWGKMVFAATSTVSVSIGTDACLNIPGFQVSVPAGMLVDTNGNCYTPAPPPIDVCLNLSGTQTSIPNGYYQDSEQNCFIQPAPPLDVCPNLDGVQSIVPIGYINDTGGNCVRPPADMCSNIDGPQATVPDSMVRDDQAVCITPVNPPSAPPVTAPTKPANPWQSPEKPRMLTNDSSGKTELKNVPSFLQPAFQPLVNMVPDSIRKAVRSLPPVVAQTFPYYIFGVLAVGAIVMWMQSLHEAVAIQALAGLIKRERSLAEEKDNFVALASHYLRTPLTLMSSGLDTIKALKETPEELIESLRDPILELDASITSILEDIESNSALQGIEAPLKDTREPSFLRSGFFWWPVITSILLTGIANFFLGVVGNVEIGTLNLWLQILTFFMVIFFFYTAIRNRFISRRNHEQQERLLVHERTIDEARSTFIERVTMALQTGLSKIADLRPNINGAHSAKFFDEGYNRFSNILTKFTLLSQIRAGNEVHEETFGLKPVVGETIQRYAKDAEEKQVTIVNNTEDINITQKRLLFEFVLGSLLDNAIKFSHKGGTIQINARPDEHKISIKVSDYGIGIPKEKLSQLFKPFSRTDSALEFNYEGLGFSLFLDKIIMDYVGGTITADSEPDKGSIFTITAAHNSEENASAPRPPVPSIVS